MSYTQLLPRWMRTAGDLWKTNAYVRSRCEGCGLELRVSLEEMIGAYGMGLSLIGRRDRCRSIGCPGMVHYRVARHPGMAFHELGNWADDKEENDNVQSIS